MTDTKEKIYEKLEKARMFVSEKMPWFVPVAMRARVVIQELPMPTMGVTENWVLAIDPRMAQEDDEFFSCAFAHEIVHLALSHCERMRNYPWQIAQIATDFAVNSLLKYAIGSKFIDIAKKNNLLLPENYGYPDLLSAEEYAEMIKREVEGGSRGGDGEKNDKEDEEKNGGDGQNAGENKGNRKHKKRQVPKPQHNEGSGATGHKADWEKQIEDKEENKITEAEKKATRRKMAEKIERQWGDAPEYIKREVRQILGEGKVDWREILQHYAARGLATAEFRRTYRRLRRPFEEWGVDLPVQRRKQGHNIVCICDTSGSMVDELEKVAAEVQKLLEVVGEVEFVCADTEIKHEPKKARSVEELEWVGGGGTDMVNAIKQIIEYYANAKHIPDVIVVLTDGYCDWNKLHEIAEPIIIVCITDAPIPQQSNVVVIRTGGDER